MSESAGRSAPARSIRAPAACTHSTGPAIAHWRSMWWLARSSTCPPPRPGHEPRPAGGRADAVGGEQAQRVVRRGRTQVGEEVDRPVLVADRDDGSPRADGLGDRAGILMRAGDRLLEVHPEAALQRGQAGIAVSHGRRADGDGVEPLASSIAPPVVVGARTRRGGQADRRGRRPGRRRRPARRRPAPRCSPRAPRRSTRRRSCPSAGSRDRLRAASTARSGA